MNTATHFNKLNKTDYMVKYGVVHVLVGRWCSLTPFKESDITIENWFIEL